MAPTTRRKRKEELSKGLESKRGKYPYLELRKQDAEGGYPVHRFWYIRDGSRRIFYPRPEDLPDKLQFPSWATDEQKRAVEKKYEMGKKNFQYLAENEDKATQHDKVLWIIIYKHVTAKKIPKHINDHFTYAYLDMVPSR